MLKKETLSQAFSWKFCESLHNDGFDFANYSINFWTTAFRFFIVNRFFVNVIKIVNLTILKLTRISFLMKSRVILSEYCTA